MAFIKPPLILFTVISVSALLLGILYDITREPVMRQQILRETEIIADLLPGMAGTSETDIFGNPHVVKIVTGYDAEGMVLGYAVTASAPGYSGPVEIMAGFDVNGRLTGVRILSERETPGLGTAIQNPSFLGQFEGRSETMVVTRLPSGDNEIAALASATISTAAVVNGINAAIEYIRGMIN